MYVPDWLDVTDLLGDFNVSNSVVLDVEVLLDRKASGGISSLTTLLWRFPLFGDIFLVLDRGLALFWAFALAGDCLSEKKKFIY